MHAIIVDLEKLKRLVVRSAPRITAERYRFIAPPAYGEALRAALMEWSVPVQEAEDINIIESAIVDVGEVLMLDVYVWELDQREAGKHGYTLRDMWTEDSELPEGATGQYKELR
jgi:hypothetical protein